MQINLAGQHIEITDSMRSYVNSRFEKLSRHFDQITNVHVVLSVEKQQQKAEATMHLTKAKIFADATDSDMYAAIDSLTDKLDRQVLKHKEKLTDHHRSESVKKQEVE